MNGLSVSAVMPAYRAAGTIGYAVESLLRQTRRPDEIIVVDDGSPDELAAVLEPYRDHVTLIRKNNGGAAAARNFGIEASRSDLIAFIDADDYWEPTKLERQLEVFDRYPKLGVAASRYYVQPPDLPRHLSPVGEDGIYGRELRVSGARVFDLMEAIWTTTVVVRRRTLGDRRFLSGLEPAEDRDMWVRLLVDSSIYIDPEPLATWILGPGSLSGSNIDRDCTNMLRVIHRHSGLLGPRELRAWESDIFRRWAAGHLGQGRPEAALAPAWQRLRRQPGSPEAWWIILKSAAMPTLTRVHSA